MAGRDTYNTRYSAAVLTAVAYPPTMMFVPVELAAVNIGVHGALWMIVTLLGIMGPIPLLCSLILAHVLFAVMAGRNPHIVSMAKAIALSKNRTRNLIPEPDGAKFVP